jgi:hypothetical protein
MSLTGKARAKKPPPPPTPPQPKPWDMPPLPQRGDDERETTFAAVGLALSKWEYFEGYLGVLYAHLVNTQYSSSPAVRAYGVISSFSTRIDMLREASAAFFLGKKKENLRDGVTELLDKAKSFAPRRNEIAHGVVQAYFAKDDSGEYKVGFAIGPSYFAARKKKLAINALTDNIEIRDAYAYTSKELRNFAAQFEELAEDALRLCIEIDEIA